MVWRLKFLPKLKPGDISNFKFTISISKLNHLLSDNAYLEYLFKLQQDEKELHEIEKARKVVDQPSKTKKLKFIQTKNQKVMLNEKLIDKTKKILGIKGYYTNLEETVADNKTIIERYHELYKIEQAFRVSKNDHQTRPIFHFKEQPIKLHVLICFVALVVSKHVELQTGVSIKRFIDESKKIVDGQLLNQITNKVAIVKAEPTAKMREIIQKLF